jgi:ABC-type nitrate/sulfonate/bicarbonate transport system substrate-binding protein
LAACNPLSPAAEPDKVSLHLKWLHQAQFAGFYMAKSAGFTSEENLELDIIPGGVGAPPIPAVLDGTIQFGVAGGGDLIKARAEGAPIVALAVIFQESPVCFIAKVDSGIQRPQDFVGRKVGLKQGTGTDIPYQVMLANVGVDRSSIEEIPASADLTPFYDGDFDVYPGFVINEPDTIRRAGYDVNVILASDYGVNMYADVLFTTEEMIAQNSDLVQRFVRAMLQGWQYATEHPEETVGVVMEYAPDSERAHQEAMLDTTIRLVSPGNVEIGSMEAATWEQMHNTLLDFGVIGSSIDVSALYTDEFLGEAK